MAEISLSGEKYMGVFNGDKQVISGTEMVDTEIGRHPQSYYREFYDGVGIVQHLSNGRRYFFTFSIGEDHCKSSLKETLEELAVNFGGWDSFLKSISFKIRKSEKKIPRISLPELNS